MARCEVCGNDYAMCFEVHAQGKVHTFDSFECAIQRMAPICEHCQCRIIGHGVEADAHWYCSAHCARAADPRLGELVCDHA
jgi:phage terminase large subunit GpA-like protein